MFQSGDGERLGARNRSAVELGGGWGAVMTRRGAAGGRSRAEVVEAKSEADKLSAVSFSLLFSFVEFDGV